MQLNLLKYELKNEGKKIFYSDDENYSLTCDRGWIMKQLENIVKNALDHTVGGNMVRISVYGKPYFHRN